MRTPEQITDDVMRDQWAPLEKDGADPGWVRRLIEEGVRLAQATPSDRYEAARKALTDYEAVTSEDHWGAVPQRLALALRALVEAPATIETPEEIADAICKPYTLKGITPAQIRDLIIQAVQAGILAAWESWEPENAPGLVGDTER